MTKDIAEIHGLSSMDPVPHGLLHFNYMCSIFGFDLPQTEWSYRREGQVGHGGGVCAPKKKIETAQD